jgi:hypothetical protein
MPGSRSIQSYPGFKHILLRAAIVELHLMQISMVRHYQCSGGNRRCPGAVNENSAAASVGARI